MENKIKNGLFIFLFIMLVLPFIQQYFPLITSGALYGYAPGAPNTDFSWEEWWNAAYQEKKGKFLNDEVGFRPDLIRVNNQLAYSLFDVFQPFNVVEGTNHSIYMGTYIDGYYGRDYLGYDSIFQKMRKLKAISDTLARLGKSLILVHSPSKEYMYPEYIPERFKTPPRTTNNFETYLRIGDSLKINQVDFNTWFYSMKNTATEVLYPKQGNHWSVYGSYLAADSLIKYIEKLRNIRMPHPAWTRIIHTTIPRDTDNDIEKILNLIYPITTETFSYPEVYYHEDATMVKPKVIYIGDSFLKTWITNGILDNTNTDWQVWLWFNVVLATDRKDRPYVHDYDWITQINNADCIVLVYTSTNLAVLGNGFIENAYDHYFPGKK